MAAFSTVSFESTVSSSISFESTAAVSSISFESNLVSSTSNLTGISLTFNPTVTVLYITISIMIFTFIISGNTLVIFAFIYSKADLRKVRNYPLVSLAVTDLMTGFIGLPPVVYANVVTSEATCESSRRNLFSFPTIALVGSSVWHLLLIAVDRCLSLTFPLKYPFMVTSRRMRFWIAIIWIVDIVPTIIPFCVPSIRDDECRNRAISSHESHAAFLSISVALVIPVFFLCMIILYTYMLTIAFNQIKKRRELTNQVDAVKEAQARMRCLVTMATVVGAFGFSLLPTTAISLAETFVKIKENVFIPLEAVFDLVIFANSAVNPLIYAYFNPIFRAGMKLVLIKWRCKKQTSTNHCI